jgi:C_GCAxxG_C_C family probable redox protein
MKMDIKKIGEKALAYDKYSGCSQSVLLALQEALEIGAMESFKAATVLSGGVARRGETCGALLGGLMSLGLIAGREDITNTQVYRDAMKPANEIIEKFKQRLQREFGFETPLNSTICRDIQEKIYGRPFDLRDEKDYQAFLDAGGHSEEGCPKVCAVAAMVTADKLRELST